MWQSVFSADSLVFRSVACPSNLIVSNFKDCDQEGDHTCYYTQGAKHCVLSTISVYVYRVLASISTTYLDGQEVVKFVATIMRGGWRSPTILNTTISTSVFILQVFLTGWLFNTGNVSLCPTSSELTHSDHSPTSNFEFLLFSSSSGVHPMFPHFQISTTISCHTTFAVNGGDIVNSTSGDDKPPPANCTPLQQ